MQNSSSNQNFSALPPINPTELARGILLAVLSVISALGNSWALMFLLRRRRDRDGGVFSLSLLNLCVADLITTVFRMAGVTVWTLTVVWLAGEPMCKVFKFFQVFGSNASTHLITLIGVDRALSICYPIDSISTARRRVKYLHIAAWTASALCSIPQSILFRLEEVLMDGTPTGSYECACVVTPSTSFIYSMFVCSTSFILPVLVLTISYSAIFVTIRRRSTEKLTHTCLLRMSEAACANKNNALTHSPSCDAAYCNNPPSRGQVVKKRGSSSVGIASPWQDNRKVLYERARRRSSLTFFIVVITFLVCWSPYYVMYLVFSITRYVDWIKETPVSVEAEQVWTNELAYWLNLFTHLNTILNPVIYRTVTLGSFERVIRGADQVPRTLSY